MNLSYTELYPNIDVYTGLLPDAEKLYKIMKQSEHDGDGKFFLKKWDKWSQFGTYTQQKNEQDTEREHGERYEEEKYLAQRVYEAYNQAIQDYIKRHNIALPEDARLMSSSFSKYDENVNLMKNNLVMQYHTDYIISERDMPGYKFLITCTTYINDDYEGGEIEFYIDNKKITHKPKAGDILVFPSTEPYYHGVKMIKKGNKFFIRNFIIYTFDGTQEWLENQKKYGAVRWADMEKQRLDLENKTNTMYLFGEDVVSYDEFVQLTAKK